MKKTFLLAALILIVDIFFSIYFFQSYRNDRKEIESRQIGNLSSFYKSALITYRFNAHAVFNNIIMMPDILTVLHQVHEANTTEERDALRHELQNRLSGRYQNLKTTLNLRQLHFHLPDGTSFLRMHRPEKYGDPLFDVRHSVKLANTNKIYVEGFEEGRIFNGYRYVFPIIDNTKHLGSVEISISISAIIEQLTHIHEQHSFYFMLDKKIFASKVFEDEKSNYHPAKLSPAFVVDDEVRSRFNVTFEPCLKRLARETDIQQKLTHFETFVHHADMDGYSIIATFLPLYNVSKSPVAYIVAFEKNTAIENRITTLITQLILTATLSLILFGVLQYLLTRNAYEIREKEKLDHLVKEKTKEIKRVQNESLERYRSTILALINLTEERDTYTAGHTKRVAEYAKMLATSMGYAGEEITKLYEASILHDIGKIVTPDSVLLKPGQLSSREYDIIKEHVIVGESILHNINFNQEIVDIVKYHHERCDGSGYPYGLTCNETPIMARILSVADTFDAMTTNRIYKPRKSVDVALEELVSLSGSKYDSVVVEHALKIFAHIHIDHTVTQLPTSVIEQERLSHYFKDPLTDLFNMRYLQLILQFGIEGKFYTCANTVAIKKFSELNRTQGWEAGNQVLIHLAELLERIFEYSVVFRIYGDDFVVLSEKHVDLDIQELQTKLETLSGHNLELSLIHFDLHDFKARQHFIEELQGIIG